MQKFEKYIMTYFVYWEGKRYAFASLDMKDYYINELNRKIYYTGSIDECIAYCSKHNGELFNRKN